MAILVLLVLVLAMSSGSGATWCVCRTDVSDATLQKTLDYACGAGADCSPIIQNGVCYNPNTVKAHCSYAVNSYFQKKGQAAGTCDFSSTAIVSTTDPSPSSTCVFPSSASSTGTTTPSNSTPTSTPTTLTPPSTTPPSTGTGTGTGFTTPTTTTPIVGGSTSGISPSGLTTDLNGASSHSKAEIGFLFLLSFWLPGLLLWRF